MGGFIFTYFPSNADNLGIMVAKADVCINHVGFDVRIKNSVPN